MYQKLAIALFSPLIISNILLSQDEQIRLTLADSLAYVDSTSMIDFETFLIERKLKKKRQREMIKPSTIVEQKYQKSQSFNNATVLNKSVTTLTFTNASAVGKDGPTQNQIDAAYSGTALEGKVTINTQGIQEWTVPVATTYTIDAYGAEGGGTHPGQGAQMKGEFDLDKGDVIKIVVGQQGIQEDGYTRNNRRAGGGGGGTFVIKTPYNNTASILVIAGGGGGSGTDDDGNIADGVIETSNANTGGDGEGGPDAGEGNSGAGFSGNGVIGKHNQGVVLCTFAPVTPGRDRGAGREEI